MDSIFALPVPSNSQCGPCIFFRYVEEFSLFLRSSTRVKIYCVYVTHTFITRWILHTTRIYCVWIRGSATSLCYIYCPPPEDNETQNYPRVNVAMPATVGDLAQNVPEAPALYFTQ